MKRVVYISRSNSKDLDKMQEAKKISKETQLPIMIGEEEFDDVFIHLIPSVIDGFFLKVVEKNYVQKIDYTNEFHIFSPNVLCIISNMENDNSISIKPRILEKHSVRFRPRISEIGIYKFEIIDDGKKMNLEKNVFEVI